MTEKQTQCLNRLGEISVEKILRACEREGTQNVDEVNHVLEHLYSSVTEHLICAKRKGFRAPLYEVDKIRRAAIRAHFDEVFDLEFMELTKQLREGLEQ